MRSSKKNFRNYSERLKRFQEEHDHTKKCIKDLKTKKRKLEFQQIALDEVQTLFFSVSEQIYEQISGTLSHVVSDCLRTIFDAPYTFEFRLERKASGIKPKMVFHRDGKEFDPVSSSGGGVLDVTSFALRVGCILLNPDIERILILDEPFKFLSVEFRHNVKEMIENLSEQWGFQFIMVTHIPELQIGKVITV